MTRVLMWLFAGPTLALLVVSMFGASGAVSALAAALGGQLAAYPVWHRIERRRALKVLRELRRLRRQPGVSVAFARGRCTRAEMTAQVSLRILGALVVAVVFLAAF